MKQTEIAQELGVSKAYISMVLSGKKNPSKRVARALGQLRVNQEQVNFVPETTILSHARLPVPTLPLGRDGGGPVASQFYAMADGGFKGRVANAEVGAALF